MPDSNESHSTDPAPEDPSTQEDSEHVRGFWRGLKLVLATVGGLLAVLIGLLIALLLVMQTNWGSARVSSYLIGVANPYEETQLEVDRVRGNWIRSLRLYDVNLYREGETEQDTIRMAHIDSVEVRYNLLNLFRRTIHLRELDVRGVDIEARESADGSWDIADPFIVEEEPEAAIFAFRIDDISLQRADLDAHFYAPDRDSTLQIRDLNAEVDQLYIHEGTSVNLEQLATRFIPPGQEEERRFEASLSLFDQLLTVRRLHLDSPYSDVAAEGVLRLPGGERDRITNIDFQLTAEPLDFRDLAGFVPDIDPSRSLQLDLQASGTSQLMNTSLEAAFSDGATVEFEGVVTPAAEGPHTYRGQLQVRQFDPYFLFLTPDEPTVRLSADMNADLEGSTHEQLSGELSTDLFEARWEDFALDRTQLSAQLEEGEARLDLRSGLRGATLTAEGTIHPFEDVPRYDLRTQFANLDLYRFTSDPEQASNLSGRLHLRGEGFAPAQADTRIDLSLSPSTINRYRINSAQLQAHLLHGDVNFSGQVNSPQGNAVLRGAAQNLDSEAPRYQIEEGRLEAVDVAALVGDTTRSRINARFNLRGSGFSPETMHIEQARIQLSDSFYGPYTFASASLNAALREGRLDVQGNLDMAEAGRFQLTAFARPFAARPSYAITQGRFQDVDIGPLLQQPEQSSELHGTVSARGAGTAAETMQLNAVVNLEPSVLNEQQITSAALDAQLTQGRLDYNLELHVPGGTTQLAGRARPFDEPMTYTAEGTFSGVNIGALTGQEAWDTQLAGQIDLEGRGTDPEAMTLAADLELDSSRINAQEVRGGYLEARLEDGQGQVEGLLDMPESQAILEARALFSEPELEYDARARLSNLHLGRLAGTDTLDARVSLDLEAAGRGTDPQTMELTGRVASHEVQYDRIQANRIDADFQLREGLLRVDTLVVQSNVASATGGGQVALFATASEPSDFTFRAQFESLAPLRPVTAIDDLAIEDGFLAGHIYGEPEALRFDLRSEIGNLLYDTYHIVDFEGTLAGMLNADRELQNAEARGQVRLLSSPQLTTENVEFDLAYADEEVSFDVETMLDQTRDLRLAGAVELHPDRQRIRLTDMDMRLDDDEWELLQEAIVTYNGEYRVSNFLLFSADQQIAIDGVIDFDGMQNLIVTIENFRIDSLSDLLGYRGLGGRVNGALGLSGPAEAPELEGTLDLDLTSYDEPVGDLELALSYDSLRLDLDAQLEHRDGSQLTAEGYMPMDLRLVSGEDTLGIAPELPGGEEMDFSIRADNFAINWARPLLDPQTVSRIDGRLSAALDMTGTPDAPELSGDAILTEGLLVLPALGTAYRDIQANAEFTGDQVQIRTLRMRSGDGQLTGQGAINMTALTLGEFDLELSADNFLAIDTRAYRAVAEADLSLEGTTRAPDVAGGVRIISADFYLQEAGGGPDVEDVQLTPEHLRTLEQRFGVRLAAADTVQHDLYQAMGLDIDLRFERDTWLRSRANPNMDIQFTGTLDLSKQPDQELQLFGSVEAVPERSRISQFGRRFNITEGVITFNGPPGDPVIDITAAYEVGARRSRGSDVVITLSLSGRFDDLDLELGSDPPMETTDIAAYLLTGRPANEAFIGGGQLGSREDFAAGLALGQLANLIEGAAGAELGLDVVEIEQDGLRGTTLTVGKYVSPRLFVAVSQPISYGSGQNRENLAAGENPTQITLEYEITRWLLARLMRRSHIRVNLLWEYAY